MHPIAETISCALATCGRVISLLVRSFDLSSLRGVRPARGGAIAAIAAAALLLPAQPALADFVQQGPKVVGSGVGSNATQFFPVAVSADGNTAIVGRDLDGGGAGAVWVFTRSGGVWTQQGNKLVGTGAAGAAQQGSSVALSADGNTALVGGLNDAPLASKPARRGCSPAAAGFGPSRETS